MTPTTMNAAVVHRYGLPSETVRVEQVAVPELDEGQVLVRVHASSMNPVDWYLASGRPAVLRVMFGLRKPKRSRPGTDLAGVVEAVAPGVTAFAVGDRVYGASGGGAYAEFVRVKVDDIVALPDEVSFDAAGAAPVAAVTALQAVRDHAGVEAGQRVLVNGAAGGVGTYTIQYAKRHGAEVTGVCSGRNVDMVRELGADHVFDYGVTDFVAEGGSYDVVIDNAGTRSARELRRVMTADGVCVGVGAPKGGPVLGPIRRLVGNRIGFLRASQRLVSFTADENPADLATIAADLASGHIESRIERAYPLAEIGAAYAHLETGHARAKLVLHP